MLNYTLDEKDDELFILYLSFENNYILAHMADGKTIRYVNTKDNLDMLLEKMKQQVLNTDIFSNVLSRSMSRLNLIEVLLSIGLSANLYVIISNSSDSPVASYLFEMLGGVVFFFKTSSYVRCRRLINDLKKNKLFVLNEELFSEENMFFFKYQLKGLNKRISEFLADKKCITINDMDDISYRDFKKLYDYLKKGKCRVRRLGKR